MMSKLRAGPRRPPNTKRASNTGNLSNEHKAPTCITIHDGAQFNWMRLWDETILLFFHPFVQKVAPFRNQSRLNYLDHVIENALSRLLSKASSSLIMFRELQRSGNKHCTSMKEVNHAWESVDHRLFRPYSARSHPKICSVCFTIREPLLLDEFFSAVSKLEFSSVQS